MTACNHSIPALRPNGNGHQFVVYGDSCSGVPGHIHEATTAAVNRVVARLEPPPEFICFLGDEVLGLTTDEQALRAQWEHWLNVEMAWLDREAIPLFHTTANHTTYDAMSERVFRDVLSHLPRNGPVDQSGLSYTVRRGDLLTVFVNTMWTGLGEGQVETAWLEQTLVEHDDARQKLIFGHHPVFPINGFAGAYQRDIEPENGRRFWAILVRHGVTAYFCSHMLAFDVQVHEGVLQIMTAGAGTKHRMPEEYEYLHAVQVALDDTVLRYQVLDDAGVCRESLDWPPRFAPSDQWPAAQIDTTPNWSGLEPVTVWRVSGVTPPGGGEAQTLISGWIDPVALPSLWIGLFGPEMRLGVLLSPQAGRSPHLWHGPAIGPDTRFELQIALHREMGPGGLLWRLYDDTPWSSLVGTSPWGVARLPPITHWSLGCDKGDTEHRPFRGRELRVRRA